MVVPVDVLAYSEAVATTPEDVIRFLDKWILPRYPNYVTENLGYTKTECFGALHSLQSAGKLHYRLKPSEVEHAVNLFLEDRFWLGKLEVSSVPIPIGHLPQAWMLQPSIVKCMVAVPQVLMEATRVLWDLVVISVMSTVYSFYKERVLTDAPLLNSRNEGKTVSKKDN